MSKGAFVSTRYYSNLDDAIRPIIVQPETLGLMIGGVSNTPAVGTPIGLSPKVGANPRTLGLHSRMVYFTFSGGQLPAGYRVGGILGLPWLRSNTAFGSLFKGATGTYLGQPVSFVRRVPESRR